MSGSNIRHLIVSLFAVQVSLLSSFSIDFGEVKTGLSECNEKCFEMISSAYLPKVKHLKMC